MATHSNRNKIRGGLALILATTAAVLPALTNEGSGSAQSNPGLQTYFRQYIGLSQDQISGKAYWRRGLPNAEHGEPTKEG